MDYTQTFENVSSSVRNGHETAPETGISRGSILTHRARFWDHGKAGRFKALLVYHLSIRPLGTAMHKRNGRTDAIYAR